MHPNHNQSGTSHDDCSLLANFTLPARLVIVGCIVGTVAGTIGYVAWIYDDLSEGNYYVAFFALPVITVMGLICLVGLKILRVCGVSIYVSDLKNDGNFSNPDSEGRQ